MAQRPPTSLPTVSLVFRGVLIVTIGSGLAQVMMAAFWTDPNSVQTSVIASMDFAWKAGVGAILGMLGSKGA